MSPYKILDHDDQKLPHKQTFSIELPGLVSIETLQSLTVEIASKYRAGNEILFINWWLESRPPEDGRWAGSRFDGSAHSQVYWPSLEDYLNLIELAPAFVEGELGVWMDICAHSSLLQLHGFSDGVVTVTEVFPDRSGATTTCRVLSLEPLRFRGRLPDDEFYELSGPKWLAIHDPAGKIRSLHHWR